MLPAVCVAAEVLGLGLGFRSRSISCLTSVRSALRGQLQIKVLVLLSDTLLSLNLPTEVRVLPNEEENTHTERERDLAPGFSWAQVF
jgi:hypothetical protein